jgi:hypothetical protein
MCRFRALVSTFSFAVVASIALPAAAIPIMPDTFEDGTTMGWGVGAQSPLPPQNIADGGPGGPGDAYLELRASGNDAPGGRLSVLNAAQWMGDYLAAGITGIQMDVRNFGPSDLTLRLLLEHFDMPGPPTDVALTVDGVFVPAGGNWTTVVFDLTNLAALPGFGTVEGALSNVDVLRLFHNPLPVFGGPPNAIPPIEVTLGVDNIAAIGAAVPEPATTALLLTGLASVLVRARRKTNRGGYSR